MRILITGHQGFIGSHLCKSFGGSEDEIVGFDIKNGPEYDVTNPQAVEDFWAENKPDIVVHLAANPRVDLSQKYPWWDTKVNVGGVINVLQASLKNDVKLFIYASTCLVYNVNAEKPMSESTPCEPGNPYSISKYTGEFYCKNFQRRGLNTCILRFFNVYGPGQSKGYVIPDLIERVSASTGRVKVLGPYDDSRDFVYVTDVAIAIRKVIEKGKEVSGQTINIGSGTETFIGNLCETIAGAFVKNVIFDYTERPMGRLPGRYQAEISKARKLLDWESKIDLEKGIKFITHRYGL